MKTQSRIATPLQHLGTGRFAAVLIAEHFNAIAAVSVAAGRYVLLVASERLGVHLTENQARSWIDAGASYVCAWGASSPSIEETFDYAASLPELGEPLPFTLMTTSHPREALEEALWFAFYNATPTDDLSHELDTVVIVVDSQKLEAECLRWVQENER